jgi:hypothetical protein
MLGMQNRLILLLSLFSNREMQRHSNDINDLISSAQLQQAATHSIELNRDADSSSPYNTQQEVTQRNAILFNTMQHNTAQYNSKLVDTVNRNMTGTVLSGPHLYNLA